MNIQNQGQQDSYYMNMGTPQPGYPVGKKPIVYEPYEEEKKEEYIAYGVSVEAAP